MRFTLSKLFLALALAAVACAGLAEPNHWFMRATVTITCLLFTFSAVRAISLVGRDRVFAIVFSIAGVAYLAASVTGAGRYLFTNYPLALLAMTKQLTVPNGPIHYSRPISSGDALDEIISGAYIVSGDSTPIARMFLIGHCAWSWIFALVAGWVASAVYSSRSSAGDAHLCATAQQIK